MGDQCCCGVIMGSDHCEPSCECGGCAADEREPTERYPPIQQDPARRIRRIQRWLGKCGAMIPCAISVWPPLFGGTNHEKLCEIADVLFAVEIDWLCRYALANENNALGIMVELDACAKALEVVKQKRDERIATERTILDDVKAWASEEINELRSLLQDAERAHSSCAFYFEIEHNRVDMFLRAVGELKRWKETALQTIAEQKARIEELEGRIANALL